ncbi:MAG: ABC transporter permease [Verrucomicrobiota bacterium]|nr:ABC transporter permease [Verrucomicrobiota bacterium]
MTLLQIIIRNLRQNAFSSALTAFSVALAAALALTAWSVRDQTRSAFINLDSGYDAVLGARGSKLQLVLNSIFHLEEPVGNVRVTDWEELAQNPQVAAAVPLAFGDNFRGFRIVGTTTNYFQHSAGLKMAAGRMFDPEAREVVVGHFAAKKLGLQIGDEIHPYHGLTFQEEHQHDEDYIVVGILAASNSPADRVLWISLAGVQHMGGHSAESAGEVSAVLVKLRSASAGFLLDQQYNRKESRLTFAYPTGRIMAQLFERINWFDRVLTAFAVIVSIVAASGISASLYNALASRQREIAIFRALGAHRSTLLGMVLLESMAITMIGVVTGWLLSVLLIEMISGILSATVGLTLDGFSLHPALWIIPAAYGLMGALAGLVPGWRAYSSEVARGLSPQS